MTMTDEAYAYNCQLNILARFTTGHDARCFVEKTNGHKKIFQDVNGIESRRGCIVDRCYSIIASFMLELSEHTDLHWAGEKTTISYIIIIPVVST